MKGFIKLWTAVLSLMVVLSIEPSPAAEVATVAEPEKPTTLLILLDGFGADLLDAQNAPTLTALGARGVSSRLTPVWPSLSRPNHWALVTGLDARHSGV